MAATYQTRLCRLRARIEDEPCHRLKHKGITDYLADGFFPICRLKTGIGKKLACIFHKQGEGRFQAVRHRGRISANLLIIIPIAAAHSHGSRSWPMSALRKELN